MTNEVKLYPCSPEDLLTALDAFSALAHACHDRLDEARDMLFLLRDVPTVGTGVCRPLEKVLIAKQRLDDILEGTPVGLSGLIQSMREPGDTPGQHMDYSAISIPLYQYLEVLQAHPTVENAVRARSDLASFRDILAEIEGEVVTIIEANEGPLPLGGTRPASRVIDGWEMDFFRPAPGSPKMLRTRDATIPEGVFAVLAGEFYLDEGVICARTIARGGIAQPTC